MCAKGQEDDAVLPSPLGLLMEPSHRWISRFLSGRLVGEKLRPDLIEAVLAPGSRSTKTGRPKGDRARMSRIFYHRVDAGQVDVEPMWMMLWLAASVAFS